MTAIPRLPGLPPPPPPRERGGLRLVGAVRPLAAPDPGDAPWTLGCETLDRDFASWDAYAPWLAPLGIRRVRLQAGWAKCERVPGVHDFAWLDHIVDDAIARGLSPLLETGYGNPAYEGGGGFDLSGGFPTSPAALAAWDAWVDAMTRRYAGRVREWAMWNEPDITPCDGSPRKTPGQIAAFNVRTARIVRRNVPDARIGGLSLATTSPEFFEKCLAAMGPDVALFDEFIYHGYAPAPESSYGNVEALKAVLARFAPRAVLRQGENGAPSEMPTRFALNNIPWSEISQAKWDLRRMLGDAARGVGSSVFTFCDFNHVGREINRKGLLRANDAHEVIAAKRAYSAVRNAVAVVGSALAPAPDCSFQTTDRTLARHEWRDEAGRPVFAFWSCAREMERVDGEAGRGLLGGGEWRPAYVRPGDSLETRPASFERPGAAPLEEPVWVDLLSGGVYAIPPERQIAHSRGVACVEIPVYDSPCVLAARASIPLDPVPPIPTQE